MTEKHFNWDKWILIYAAIFLPMHYYLAVTPWVYLVWTTCLLYSQFLIVGARHRAAQCCIAEQKKRSEIREDWKEISQESQTRLRVSPTLSGTLSGYVGKTEASRESETETWYVKTDDLDERFKEVSDKIDAKLFELQATGEGVQAAAALRAQMRELGVGAGSAYGAHGALANMGQGQYQNSTESMRLVSDCINQGIMTDNGVVPITTTSINNNGIPAPAGPIGKDGKYITNETGFRGHTFRKSDRKCIYCDLEEDIVRIAGISCCRVKK